MNQNQTLVLNTLLEYGAVTPDWASRVVGLKKVSVAKILRKLSAEYPIERRYSKGMRAYQYVLDRTLDVV